MDSDPQFLTPPQIDFRLRVSPETILGWNSFGRTCGGEFGNARMHPAKVPSRSRGTGGVSALAAGGAATHGAMSAQAPGRWLYPVWLSTATRFFERSVAFFTLFYRGSAKRP
jgi:hypothetical protein